MNGYNNTICFTGEFPCTTPDFKGEGRSPTQKRAPPFPFNPYSPRHCLGVPPKNPEALQCFLNYLYIISFLVLALAFHSSKRDDQKIPFNSSSA